MKILLVEDEPDLRGALARAFVHHLAAELVEADCGQQAMDCLKSNSGIDVVVCDYNMQNGTGGDLFRYMVNTGIDIPFILCSSHPAAVYPEFQNQKIAGSVVKPNVLGPLIALLENFRKPGEIIDGTRHQFFPLGIDAIARVGKLCGSLYIQIGEAKYVKVMNVGDQFGREEVDRFRNKKRLEALFISADDCEKFIFEIARATTDVNDLARDLSSPESIQRLAEAIDDSDIRRDLFAITKLIKAARTGVDLNANNHAVDSMVVLNQRIGEHIVRIGFSVPVQALAAACVEFALKTICETETLVDLIARLKSKPSSYRCVHSVYVAYIACSIASMMTWNSDATRRKLALAALLHDTTLDDEQLVPINKLDKAAMLGLGKAEIKKIKLHPAEAVALLKSADDVFSYNVETIVMQHHERPDGSGFPAGLSASKIAPLSAVFIVAHDLVDELLAEKDGFSLAKFVKKHSAEYNAVRFRKIVQILEALTPKL